MQLYDVIEHRTEFCHLRNSQIAGAAKIACQQQLLLVEQSTMLRRTEYDIT